MNETSTPQSEGRPGIAIIPGAQRPLLILHVNDNTDDQVLFQAACKKAGVPIQWHVAETAKRGISYLQSLVAVSRKQEVHWPDLVLLDVIMPDGSGFEVLKYIRSTPRIRNLPVAVFTGDPTPATEEEALRLGANSFHRKPSDFEQTVTFARGLYLAWSTAARPQM